MLEFCYYKKITGEVSGITKKEIEKIKDEKFDDYLWAKKHLFRRKDCKIPMVYVSVGEHQGFRRKGRILGNTTHTSRGEAESLTHQIHVEAIYELKEFSIKLYNTEVKLFIKSVESEKRITCNNKVYEVDLAFTLEKTIPAEYYDYFNGVFYLEIFHTCPIDSTQAEDFAVENLILYEYKILKKYTVPDWVQAKDIEERINKIKNSISKKVLNGYPVCTPKDIYDNRWKLSKKGNWYTKVNQNYYTIYKKEDKYCISISKEGKEALFVEEFNGRDILDLEGAKKIANYIVFKEEYQDNE